MGVLLSLGFWDNLNLLGTPGLFLARARSGVFGVFLHPLFTQEVVVQAVILSTMLWTSGGPPAGLKQPRGLHSVISGPETSQGEFQALVQSL